MPRGYGYGFGANLEDPGQYLTKKNRFARLLNQDVRGLNNGSKEGGWAHVLNRGLAGLMIGMDSQEQEEAKKMLALAMSPEIDPITEEMNEGVGVDAYIEKAQDSDNPYVTRNLKSLLMQKMGEDKARRKELADRSYAEGRQELGWERDDERYATRRDNELADAKTARGHKLEDAATLREQRLADEERLRKQGLTDYEIKLKMQQKYSPKAGKWETVKNPYGRGGTAQRNTASGKISDWEGPEKAPERITDRGPDGVLRYRKTGEPVYDQSTIGPKPRDPKLDFDQETKLRNEFHTGAKDYVKVRDAYKRIQAAAADPSPAGDLALIFNYMKVLDPGSTVREGEFATAAASGSFGDRVKVAFEKVKEGTRLSATQRKDFVDRAKRLYSAQEKSYEQWEERYRGLAGSYKLDPDKIIFGMGKTVPQMPAQTDTPPPPPGSRIIK